MRFDEALDEFILEKSLDTSPRTRELYQWRLGKMASFTGAKHLEDLTPKVLLAWLLSMRDMSPTTQYDMRRDSGTFFRWCVRRGYLATDPTTQLPRPRKPRRERPAYFTTEQVKSLLAEARKGYNGKRETALVNLLLDTGIRAGEAANLQLEDIDWENRTLAVQGKTGQRTVPVSLKALRHLRTYIRSHRHAPKGELHVFTSREGNALTSGRMTLILRRLAQRAGVDGVKTGPHTYRHTFAVMYTQAGGDAFSLQRILGHSSIETTSIYVLMSAQDLKLAHARFSPLRTLA